MKKKDLVYAILAAIILVVAGVVAVTQLAPKKTAKSSASEVEIVRPISGTMDQSALGKVLDSTKARDYGTIFDLTVGLNNTSPFGK